MILAIGMACILAFGSCHAQSPATNSAPATAAVPQASIDAFLRQAFEHQAHGESAAALDCLKSVLQLDPRNVTAYLLRGSIYAQKNRFADAETDYRKAITVDPANNMAKFDLAELKFMTKNYVDSRPMFVSLQTDPDIGDIAVYRVYLCDLFGGHEAIAAKELDVFNQAAENPSYYYGNVAWDVYHHKTDDARDWLASAVRIYSPRKNSYYASSLNNLGYLPLPSRASESNGAATRPAAHELTIFQRFIRSPRLMIGLALVVAGFIALVTYVIQWIRRAQRRRRRRPRSNRRSKNSTEINTSAEAETASEPVAEPALEPVTDGESDDAEEGDDSGRRGGGRRSRRGRHRDAY